MDRCVVFEDEGYSGEHLYNGSEVERDMLVNAGWIYEGIGWFGTLR